MAKRVPQVAIQGSELGNENLKMDLESKSLKKGIKDSNQQSEPKIVSKKEIKAARLLKEIKSLGGDQTDLDLLKDVMSDSDADAELNQEFKETRKIDEKALQVDLGAFMKKFDFSNFSTVEDDDVIIEPKQDLKIAKTVELEPILVKNEPKNDSKIHVEDRMVDFIGLKFKPEQKWFDRFEKLTCNNNVVDSLVIIEKRRIAQQIWDADVEKYKKTKMNSKMDNNFLTNILKNGTQSDKISALTLLVQDSPVHNFNVLKEQLMGMVSKTKRRETLQAVESIKDLFINTILPDRKLKYFMDQPLDKCDDEEQLMLWLFEDAIKKIYHQFVSSLEGLLQDELDHVKTKGLNSVFDLLCAKPEQEANLLALIINQMVND